MRYLAPKSISSKLLFPIALMTLLLLLFVVYVWLPTTTRYSTDVAVTQVNQTLAGMAEGLVPQLLQGQLSNVYDTLNLVKDSNPNWIDLQLFDKGGNSLYPLVALDLPTSDDSVRVLKHKIQVFEDPIGELVLVFNSAAIEETFRSNISQLISALLVTFLAVVSVLAIILHTQIIQPIKLLTIAANSLKHGNYSDELPAEKQDEIGLLVNSFAKARSALYESRHELVKARDEADAANIAKSDFLANMSHELRTPMTGVLGITDLLLQDVSSKSERTLLHAISQSGRRLLSTLNDVLDLSKIEAGGLELDLVKMNFARNVNDTVDLFAPIAAKKQIGLELIIDSDFPGVIADAVKIDQVVTNLVNNAVKFTSKGKVTIKVKLDQTREDTRLYVEVIDTGVGIAPNRIDRVFEKFLQEDMSVTRKFGGTGLGLAISSNLVTFLGGKIGVESEQDKGSVFWFWVPVDIGSQSSISDPKSEIIQAQSNPSCVKDARVMLVEDEPINLLFAEKVFEKLGISNFTLVENGQEAIDRLRVDEFDIVFMDCQMPVLDGYKATEILRRKEALDARAPMPIIAITANAMVGDREKCLRSGMSDVLTKPYSTTDLSSVIEKWL